MKELVAPWAMDVKSVQDSLKTGKEKGLTSAEAEARLKKYGFNTIIQRRPITFGSILLEEIREPLILLLLAIGIIYSIWGKLGDTVTILFVILAVTLSEVYTEYKAKKSIESLKKLSLPTTWVIRDGKPVEIDTSRIVPGDVLILKSGVRIGADARMMESFGLMADESQLTGESMGVSKTAGFLPENTGLSDRSNMVHMGSAILKGKGTAIAVSTGMDTELGKIAGLAQETGEPKTPLQKSMKQLSKNLIGFAAAFSVLIPVLGLLRGFPLKDMILTGLSLSFATIPEEMPILVTMLLGLGAIKLSKKNVLIRRTRAAETLGSVTVIATDKTGTLTQNQMSIAKWEAEDEWRMFTIGALMADVDYDAEGGFLGDPMDRAVVEHAGKLGIDRKELLKEYKLIRDDGFDENKKIYQAVYQKDGTAFSFIKGAPESVFSLSKENPELEDKLKKAVASGYRTIAMAFREDSEEKYTAAGLILFDDPIRKDVRRAVSTCTNAGVRVIMITGDHAGTAKRVAENVGLEAAEVLTGDRIGAMSPEELAFAVRQYHVFARITPEQKLNIVRALHQNGEVVAVTGDGINDSAALKAADCGISMGVSGTDIAKEASDMILTDDSFSSIVAAIEEGRRLYDNLSKCVKYYLACKIGLILCFLAPMLFNAPMPFSPVQIIILELFMDLAASTSFVSEPPESDLLSRKPRDPKESFMNRRMITGIFSGGITLSALVLTVFFVCLSQTGSLEMAQTYAFTAWLFGHVCLALNMRTDHIPLMKAGVFSSRSFNLWIGGVVVFLLAALHVPLLREYLKLGPIGILSVIMLACAAALATSWMEIRKYFANSGSTTG